ncbi:energy-coupling factor transporter ATP-binding protein EcfA2 [Arthrobacter ulcerisalmonis]|nr:ATP/GTP-binding protein [Arthrobacter ulcerisalmonis]MDQ0665400.1 energy-coupling factor transporter ATP-binding protein EcfA2 [Arthrobacter ulcerisalmonis]
MEQNKVAREQQLAVFGESGSGKTVLLSSFYGLAVEQLLSGTEQFDVLAADNAQGRRLHQNYLGMKNSALLPMTNHFSATSYAFSIKRKPGMAVRARKAPEELRLVWHDYPGEWFEQEPSGPEEAERRIDTFRALLGSDVALVLVDSQKLLDNAGEEERYLKHLLTGLSTQLLKLRDNLLQDDQPLVTFPRIWLMALSKADLLPDIDVTDFRDLLVEKAGVELNKLQEVIATFVEVPEALSVGDDFVLLSSAQFEPGKIEVTKRVGLDLILPIAAMLPFSRYVRWALAMRNGAKVAEHLLSVAKPVADFIGNDRLALLLARLPGPIGNVVAWIGPFLMQTVLDLTGTKVLDMHAEAKAKHDFLTETLTGFQLELDRGDSEKVLLRSRA